MSKHLHCDKSLEALRALPPRQPLGTGCNGMLLDYGSSVHAPTSTAEEEQNRGQEGVPAMATDSFEPEQAVSSLSLLHHQGAP